MDSRWWLCRHVVVQRRAVYLALAGSRFNPESTIGTRLDGSGANPCSERRHGRVDVRIHAVHESARRAVLAAERRAAWSCGSCPRNRRPRMSPYLLVSGDFIPAGGMD